MSKWFIAGALGLSLIADSLAQRPAPSADAMRSIEFVTDEGTWISLDVAPDGRTIAFELFGDVCLEISHTGLQRFITDCGS